MSALDKPSFAVLFDVFHTLVSLDTLRSALMRRGLPSHALMLFFHRILQDAFALHIAGVPYQPFAEVASASLVVTFRIHGQTLSQQEARTLLEEECGNLEAVEDVLPAVRMLSAAGIELWAFSNGSKANTERLLKRNHLDSYFKGVISIDDAKAWKPSARVRPGRRLCVNAHPRHTSMRPVPQAIVSKSACWCRATRGTSAGRRRPA